MKLPLRAAAVLAVAAVNFGCARPGAPSGGVRDVRPPVVISTEPAPSSTVEDPGTVIRFRFNERISERPRQGTLDEAVLVSPRVGVVRVKHGSDALDVSVEGGLRPDLVYRFTLLPVIADLFGNAMRDPFEVVVSTGAPLIEDALAGQVLDRITGRAVPNAEVQLVPPSPTPDTVLHIARSDQNGLFAFRYIPAGSYSLVAFLDRNRNLAPDPVEPRGLQGVRMNTRDTLFSDVVILEPDTSRAQLLRGEVVDSVTLRLTFSDYLDPDPQSMGQIAISVEAPEGLPIPSVTRVIHPITWEAQRDSARTRAAAAAGPSSRLPTPGATLTAPGQERGGLPRGVPLPRQDVIVALGSPLEPSVPYRVAATGAVNLNEIAFGGGETTVTRTPTPPPAQSAAQGAEPAVPGAEPAAVPDPVAPAPDSSVVAPPR